MKSLVFTGIAASALAFAATSVVASDSFSVSGKDVISNAAGAKADNGPAPVPPVMGGGMHGGMPRMGGGHIGPRPGMPHRMGGGHIGPRPGYHGIPRTDVYRRPFRNFILPSYWVQPSFFVNDYRIYGLSAPQNGYYWSRYYNDAVMINARGNVYDYRPGVQWNQGPSNYTPQGNYAPQYAPQGGNYQQADYGPAMSADREVYNNDDLAYSGADGSKYDYEGEWNGNYVDQEGRVFEGEWNGTVTRYGDGDAGANPRAPQRSAGAPYPQSYPAQPSYNPEQRGYAQCLQSNGLTGAAIGGILGGVAGNRIVGRGDRLGGSLLGVGLGGLAGLAVEKAVKKCRKYAPRGGGYEPQVGYPQQQGYPQQSYPPVYQNSYPTQQGGYYYYPQAAPTTTTITVTPGTTSTTTTTTEEVVYETYYTTAKRRSVPKSKPRPKAKARAAHCHCR